MVRAYDRRFLSTLNLRSMGTDINTEILYKAELLGAKVVEIPAHLDWTFSQSGGRRRRSLSALANSTNGYLLSGFMFRPVLFFIGPGLVVLAAALYTLGWVSYRVANHYLQQTSGSMNAKITNAIQLLVRGGSLQLRRWRHRAHDRISADQSGHPRAAERALFQGTLPLQHHALSTVEAPTTVSDRANPGPR